MKQKKENKPSDYEVIQVKASYHLLPGIGNIDYIFLKSDKILIANLNGFEVLRVAGEQALEIKKRLITTKKSDYTSLLKDLALTGFGTDIEILKIRTRQRKIVEKRMILMWYLERYSKLSLDAIGQLLGGFGHCAVLYAKNTVNNLCSTNNDFKELLEKFLSSTRGLTNALHTKN